MRCLLLLVVMLLLSGCERESRPFRDLPVSAARTQAEAQSSLHAGTALPDRGTLSPFQENAWGQAEGKRLFTQFNCTGCHAHGAGAIGPALMDEQWRYGYSAMNIFSSIVEGRPDGMPSFRNKLTDTQVWQLVAYVQSLSGQTPVDAAPGRSDHMRTRTPENATPFPGRRHTGHQ
jgi:cytochrome c oxidase cbb3-type subunit III